MRNKKSKSYWLSYTLLVISLFTLCSGLIFIVYFSAIEIKGVDTGDLGTLGDFFGGLLNPVLSFISICLITYTLWQNNKSLIYSSKELRLSREEMGLMRKEYAKTAEANKEHVQLIKDEQRLNKKKYIATQLETELQHLISDFKKHFSLISFERKLKDGKVVTTHFSDIVESRAIRSDIHMDHGAFGIKEDIVKTLVVGLKIVGVLKKINKNNISKLISKANYLSCDSNVFAWLEHMRAVQLYWNQEFFGSILDNELILNNEYSEYFDEITLGHALLFSFIITDIDEIDDVRDNV